MTDVEGHWAYFCNFVELSEGLTFAEDGDQREARCSPELIVKDDWHFVFGGDTCDKGPGSLRCLETLVSAKKRHPDRVHLLLGNRDINKMRYTSEFTDEEVRQVSPETPGAYWVPEDKRVSPWSYFASLAAQAEGKDVELLTHEEVQRYCTKPNLMRYHLKYDMGSDGEFEFRRQELAHMSTRNVAEVSDEEVVNSYEASVAEGGVMREYLRLSEVACILGSTLFVHGQIIGNQFSDCGRDGVAWAVGCVPSDDGATSEWVSDLKEWVAQINTWARRNVAAWQAQPTWRRSPAASTFEDWCDRGGAGLIAYGTPATRVPSVVYCRWLEDNCMPKQYPQELVEHLQAHGICRVVVGHTPHGNCPTVIPHEGLTVIMGDTSYSCMKADLAYPGDNRGDAVCEIALEGEKCFVRGFTGYVDGLSCHRQVVHYAAPGGADGGGDPHIGIVQPESEEVPEDKRFFVKACLAALEGYDARYLLCKVDGFTNTYQEESPDEVIRVFGSHCILPSNQSRRLEIASFGEEFGAGFTGAEGDVVERIFRRLDRNHDGAVTAHELRTACSDSTVRMALQWTFPDTCLEEVFHELDTNKDGLVSLHEFETRFRGTVATAGSQANSRCTSRQSSMVPE
ncbi:unnamed protein product [Symbiodinium natans]|uniref:EF-hand domain-containing protein n=1 Tax=Symbiodinium natans TaxID=878477 RepID=A0A812MHB9_9DINO|nr:unnamed protein product [Symbiodinium natans]